MLKQIQARCKQIQWNQGVVCIMSILVITIFLFALVALMMWYSNYFYCSTISMTRADAIADGVAVYAQSFDYEYNKAQGDIMTSLLTRENNELSNKYTLDTSLVYGDRNDQLTIWCTAVAPNLFPSVAGETIEVQSNTTVTSVDIWGDIFIVPDSMGTHVTPTPAPAPSDSPPMDISG